MVGKGTLIVETKVARHVADGRVAGAEEITGALDAGLDDEALRRAVEGFLELAVELPEREARHFREFHDLERPAEVGADAVDGAGDFRVGLGDPEGGRAGFSQNLTCGAKTEFGSCGSIAQRVRIPP